jgi:exopolysaccharide biosynthesis polyprenyl glycosylphosphotransferase
MLKEHATVFRRLAMMIDMAVVTVSFIIAYILRDKINDIYPLETYIGFLPIVLALWGLLLHHFGVYMSLRTRDAFEVISIVTKSAVIAFLIFSSLLYIFKLPHISRGFISLIFLISGWMLIFEKISALLFLKYIRRKGMNYRNILLVGTGARAQRFIETMHRHKEWGFRVIGLIDDDPHKMDQIIKGHRVIGRFNDIPQILQHTVVDEVAFVVPRSWLNRIEESIHYCETQGIRVHVALDIFNLKLSKVKQTDMDGLPLLTYESAPDQIWSLLFKRFLDISVSLVLLALLAPVFLVVAVGIKLTSPGPVFYKQGRVGLNGRKFVLFKFRTMVVGAEKQLNDLMAFNEMKGHAFKMKNDPRLIKIGPILRQYSIDELPQFWNVLKGDMSLVGPRPPLPDEVINYEPWHRRKLSMRPGITCIWQVGGRNRIKDFEEWLKLDLQYIDNWSLWLDIKLFFKTIPAVLLRHGAY